MRRIRIRLDNPNYIQIANTHIFINFNRENLMLLDLMDPKRLKKIHVFITDANTINDGLEIMIQKYGKPIGTKTIHRYVHDKPTGMSIIDHTDEIGYSNSRIIIHLPKHVESLKTKLLKSLSKVQDCYKLIISRSDTIFIGVYYKGSSDYLYRFTYFKKFLFVEYRPTTPNSRAPIIEYPHYEYNVNEFDSIVNNPEVMKQPMLLRDHILVAFKKECPPKILKSFKNDDEIWNHILSGRRMDDPNKKVLNGCNVLND